MSDAIETIDASRMEILSEFAVEYVGDEETLAPHLSSVKKVFIGKLDGLAVLSSSAANGQMTPDLALDKSNFSLLAEMLDKTLKGDFTEESLYVENGEDKLGVGVNSNFPHTLTAPFERIYLINLRPIFLNEGDRLDQGYAGLKLPPQSAARLCEEMKNLIAENRI
ncbi:MAG TPA: hypothetical protein VGC76_18345 [Pyrinomonadaceae bacterium]|jgi:hypothetical protein